MVFAFLGHVLVYMPLVLRDEVREPGHVTPARWNVLLHAVSVA